MLDVDVILPLYVKGVRVEYHGKVPCEDKRSAPITDALLEVNGHSQEEGEGLHEC